MTPQDIFNTVKTHLLVQGVRSMRLSATSCAYRGQDGTKCAAGCLIPDEVYDPKMEGMDIHYVVKRYSGLEHLWEFGPLLSDLQSIHDSYTPAQWQEKLGELEKTL